MNELVRIKKVLDLLRSKNSVTVDDFLESLSISYETWNRLRKKLVEELKIPIEYCRKEKAYKLAEDDSDFGRMDLGNLNRFLENYSLMEMLMKKAGEDIDVVYHIEFEQPMNLNQFVFFDDLVFAMKNQIIIQLTHQGYYNSIEKQVLIHPLYIKQFQNRWYLIAQVNGVFKSYGLDRIKQVVLTQQKFISTHDEAKALYQEIVGLNYADAPRQRILIEFAISQKPYVVSLPLHHTQKVIQENQESFQVELWVRPNYELQQQIQKYGSFAKVIEGDWICL